MTSLLYHSFELWATGKYFLLHNNAHLKSASSIEVFLSVHQIIVLLHVPYYTDLSPCDFLLFPQLKWALTGHSDGCDKTALQHFIKCLPELLQQHLKWCTDAWGNYFKGYPWHKSVSTPYSFLYHQSWNVWPPIVLRLNISHTHMLTYVHTHSHKTCN